MKTLASLSIESILYPAIALLLGLAFLSVSGCQSPPSAIVRVEAEQHGPHCLLYSQHEDGEVRLLPVAQLDAQIGELRATALINTLCWSHPGYWVDLSDPRLQF